MNFLTDKILRCTYCQLQYDKPNFNEIGDLCPRCRVGHMSPIPLCCYECGLLYSDPGWLDTHVPDWIWEIISPAVNKKGGILCITCISRRLVKAHIPTNKCFIRITSGPFNWREPWNL